MANLAEGQNGLLYLFIGVLVCWLISSSYGAFSYIVVYCTSLVVANSIMM